MKSPTLEAEIPGFEEGTQTFGPLKVEPRGTGFLSMVNGVPTYYFAGVEFRGGLFDALPPHTHFRLWHETADRSMPENHRDRRPYNRPYVQLQGAMLYLDEFNEKEVQCRLLHPSASRTAEDLREKKDEPI